MTDLAIVVFVAVLVFAATRIPAIGDALGRAVDRLGRRADAGPRRDGGPPPAPPSER